MTACLSSDRLTLTVTTFTSIANRTKANWEALSCIVQCTYIRLAQDARCVMYQLSERYFHSKHDKIIWMIFYVGLHASLSCVAPSNENHCNSSRKYNRAALVLDLVKSTRKLLIRIEEILNQNKCNFYLAIGTFMLLFLFSGTRIFDRYGNRVPGSKRTPKRTALSQ